MNLSWRWAMPILLLLLLQGCTQKVPECSGQSIENGCTRTHELGRLRLDAREDPARVMLNGREYVYQGAPGTWQGPAPIESRIMIKVRVSDPKLLQALEKEREARLAREPLR